MKWIALALILFAAPALAAWLRSNPRQAPYLWGLLTFLPFVLAPWNLGVAPFSIPTWSGYVKGYEINLLDAVAFAVVFGTRGRWPRLVLIVPFVAYVVAVFLSVFQARFGDYSFSYVVQLLRVGLVFLAIARVAAMENGERALVAGLVLGLTLQAAYAFWEKAGGALQTGGSLGHQNLLGFVTHMALMPLFALFLSGKTRWWVLLGVIMGIAIVIMTASRATMAFAGFGLVLTLLLSLTIHFTGRKAAVGLAGLLILLISSPFAMATMERRLQAQGTTFLAEDLERAAFEKAAKAMIADHPMGVGANHYVFISNTEGYSDQAGVGWYLGARSTAVHNTYLLVTAETGFLGLATLLILLASAIITALRSAVRFRKRPGSEVFIGLAAGLIAVVLHGLVEWMLVVDTVQYVFASSLGLIVGIRSRLLAVQRTTSSRTLMRRSFIDQDEVELRPA